MGLDVYLIGEEKTVECICECGHKHSKTEREVLYDANITHNLNAAESLNDRIQKLFKEGKHEEITRIALELNSELKRVYENKLSGYPSLNGG